MLRPISYWVDGEAQIWLFGNPVIWWGSTAGMIVLVYQLIRGKLKAHRKSIALLVVGAYVINMAPFIGITRVMFLYHYMIALVWALIGVGLLLDKVSAKNQAYLLGLVMITFFIVAPFTYGVSPDAFSTAFRTLLPSWR
jgi:dolichyl-phosphate-mannose-protein mannosyltransferase